MEQHHTTADQKLVCSDIPVTSALGQALRRGGYSLDGNFLNKDEALAWAILEKQTDLVKAIVRDGVNIDLKTGPEQTTALHLAARVGSCDIISILEDADASREEKDAYGFTPLLYAVHKGNIEATELLCDFAADTKCCCNNGGTPLHHAARSGNIEIIQLLLDRDIDVDCLDNGKRTPLSPASASGEIGAVQLLVEQGANISLRTKMATHLCTTRPGLTTEYFIELGADLTAINDDGYNVLSIAALNKAQKVVDLIVQWEDVDVNQKDQPSVIVPLISAARSGSVEIARILVENGALLEITDSHGNTPLHNASVHGHPEVARFLLDKGANIESLNTDLQRTPFLTATMSGNIRVVRLLAEHGANREVKDAKGCCALHYTYLLANNLLLRYLLKLGVDMEAKFPHGETVLERAIADGKTEVASALLESGASTKAKGNEKYTIMQRSPSDQLIACIKHGHITQMQRLLDGGVDINALNISGRSALSVAAEYGHQQLIDLVLQSGGLLDLQDSNGETALWWASQSNHLGVVQRLLELGAKVDLPDSDGNTPLCVACQNGFADITKCLLEAGGDPNTTTTYGMTPMLFAVNANHMKVVGLLINKDVATLGQIVEGSIRPEGITNLTRYFCDRYDRDFMLKCLGDEEELMEFYDRISGHSVKQSIDEDDLAGLAPTQQIETNSADDCGNPIYGDQLAFAAWNGFIPQMLRLIKVGANINGSNGAAVPLVCAASQNQERAVQVLLENGAQVNMVNQDGETALHRAAVVGNKTIISLLCQYQADIEHRAAGKPTPLACAVMGGHADAVEILLDRGAKTELSDDNEWVPLQVAAIQGSVPVIEVLLRKGMDVRNIDRAGLTPLLYAVSQGKWDVTETLLKNRAGHDLVPGSKHSPMSEAIRSGQAAMVELLAKYGADIDNLEESDQTPLIMAAKLGKDLVVQSLIDMGADLDRKDDKDRTALSYAKENGQRSTLKLLLQAQTLRRDDQYMKKAKERRKDPKTSFEYRPLSEGFIRVLELHPGQKGKIICFSLIHVELSKAPSFGALSYGWKGKVGTVPTRCDGERILVMPNCHAALEVLRSETETRTLWIDAICINQQDSSERGIQVSMMSEIYSKATSVLMWFGKEEDHSDMAFDSIPVLSRAVEEIRKSPESGPASLSSADRDLLLGLPEIQNLTEQLKVAPKTWKAWKKLYRRSYFTRAWIFQEIILAGPRGTVMCGTRQCSWDAFQAALQAYRNLQFDHDECLEAIMLNDFHFRFARYLSLDVALRAMSSFKAGNPCDKVFAALGFALGGGTDRQTWEPIPIPKVDYNKPVEEVFINANRYIISVHGRDRLWFALDPMNQSKATGETRNLPSWAFDFSKQPINWSTPFDTINAKYAEYHTLLLGRPMTTQTSLHVNGYVVDTVNYKISITKDKSTVDIVKMVVACMAGSGRGVYDPTPNIGKHGVQYGSHDELEKSFSRTNLAALLSTLMRLHNCSADKGVDFAAYLVGQLMTDNETSEIFKQPPGFLVDGIKAWEESSKELPDFDLTVCKDMEIQHNYEWDLVYTERGYFGLTRSREGDEGLVVTVVGGCRELVLLRAKSSGENIWYEFVSKVYMYDWTEDKIETVEDLGDQLMEVRFEIR